LHIRHLAVIFSKSCASLLSLNVQDSPKAQLIVYQL